MTTLVLASLFVLMVLGCAVQAGATALKIAELAHRRREADDWDRLRDRLDLLEDDVQSAYTLATEAKGRTDEHDLLLDSLQSDVNGLQMKGLRGRH